MCIGAEKSVSAGIARVTWLISWNIFQLLLRDKFHEKFCSLLLQRSPWWSWKTRISPSNTTSWNWSRSVWGMKQLVINLQPLDSIAVHHIAVLKYCVSGTREKKKEQDGIKKWKQYVFHALQRGEDFGGERTLSRIGWNSCVSALGNQFQLALHYVTWLVSWNIFQVPLQKKFHEKFCSPPLQRSQWW